MSNTKFFNDAVAEAKEIRETALANAKLALEEAFTPQIQSMLEKKLQEESEDLDETKDEMDEAKSEDAVAEAKEDVKEDARTDAEEEGYQDGIKDAKADIKNALKSIKKEDARTDAEEEGYKDGMKDAEEDARNEDARTDAEEEGYLDGKRDSSIGSVTRKIEKEKYEEGTIEEIDLDELLAELEAADQKVAETQVPADTVNEKDDTEAERADVDKYEYEKGKEAGKADDEDEVGEITVDELRDIIRDVITDVIGGGDVEEEGEEEIEMHSDEEEIEISEKKEVDEVKDEVKEDKTQAELNEAIGVITTLKSELNEVNLLNAKLLYVNKLFRNKTLTEAQKVKVINAFDRAESVKEVKNIFETIKDAITPVAKKPIQENRGFASKAAGVAPKAKQPIVEGDNFVSRMQKLAGIIN